MSFLRAERRALENYVEALPQRPKRSVPALPSRLGPDLVITGVLEGRGVLEVQGRVDGHIKVRDVVVAESARIAGSIVADTLRIRGSVEGPVRANNVEISKTARVIGKITHLNLSVEAGAYLEGHRPWRPRPLGDAQEQFTFAETD